MFLLLNLLFEVLNLFTIAELDFRFLNEIIFRSLEVLAILLIRNSKWQINFLLFFWIFSFSIMVFNTVTSRNQFLFLRCFIVIIGDSQLIHYFFIDAFWVVILRTFEICITIAIIFYRTSFEDSERLIYFLC